MRALLTVICLAGLVTACSTPTPRDLPAEDGGAPVETEDGGSSEDGGQPACGPDNCTGCCNEMGACLTGHSSEACGKGGEACFACGDSVCTAGECVMQAAQGDRCDTAVQLKPNSEGYAQITVDLSKLKDDTKPVCGKESAKDAVFFFDVAKANSYVEVTATSTAGARPVLAVRESCEGPNDVNCGAATSRDSVTVSFEAQTGRLFVWLESLDAPGQVKLELRVTAPIATGDTCAAPKSLSFTGDVATTDDNLALYAPDGFGCALSRRDAVYTFTLVEKSDVTVTVTPKASTFNPGMRIEAGGCTANGADCVAANGAGEAETSTMTLEAGTHSIIVSSEDGSYGAYTLRVEKKSLVPQNACSKAVPLTFTNGKATSTVVFSTQPNNFDLPCLGRTSGPDAVYRFSTTQVSDFTARMSSPSYIGVAMAVRSACDGANIACGYGLSIADLPAGDYYLVVDAPQNTTTSYFVNVESTSAKAAGTSCARPIPITLSNGQSGGTGQVTASFTGATDNVPNNCGGTGSGGNDQIYSFTINQPLIMRAKGTPTGTNGTLALRLMKSLGECVVGGWATCTAATRPTVSLDARLEAGTYWLVAESTNATGYTLDLNLEAITNGEYCGTAIPFTFPVGGSTCSDSNTTIKALEDNSNNACAGYDMPDRVYGITTADAYSNLSATITARSGNNAPKMFIADGQCGQIVPLKCEGAVGSFASRTLKMTALPAGSYNLWAEGPTTAGADYDLAVTTSPTPAGDTCKVALPLSFTSGVAQVTGDTTGFADDFMSCNQISPAFGDVVYSFTTAQEYDLKATMTPTSTTARGSLSMLEDTCQVDSTYCMTASAPGPAVLKAGSLPAGPHFISADYSSGGPGPYTLKTELLPHQPGETCDSAMPLVFSNGAAGGTATVNMDFRDYFDSPTGDCGGSAADVYYTFTTNTTLDLRLKTTRTGSTGTIKASLVNQCGTTLGCDTMYSDKWAKGSLPPGTYTVMLDLDYVRDEGAATLEFSLTPPAPADTCATAIDLGIPATGGTATMVGTTVDAFDEYTSTCAYLTYGDHFYKFTTTQTLSLTASVTNSSGTKAHSLALLGSTCGGTALTCAASTGGQTTIRSADLPPGTYFIAIDSAEYNSPRDYTLTVRLGDRPVGDRCTTALPLGLPTSGPGEAMVSGDTRNFFNDLTPSCGTGSTANISPDQLYTFTTTGTMNLRLYVKGTTASFRPTVALRKGCAATDSDQRCAYVPSFATDAWTTYVGLPAGTWYLSVDGYDKAQEGAFDLTARLTPYNLPGESCSMTAPVTLSQGNTGKATLNATMTDYFHDHSDCWASDGADIVYAVQTNQSRRIHVQVESSPSVVQPDVSIRQGTCNSTSSALVCKRPTLDGVGRASATIASGTSYVLVKSPLAYPQGTIATSISVDDFPAGDICSQALPLTFSSGAAGGTASVTGNLFNFGAEQTPSCGTDGMPDAYYTFTTNQTLNLNVTLDRADDSATFAMALLGGCGGTELICKNSGFTSANLTFTKSALPAGTYVLLVTGGSQNPAGFTLNATLSP